MEVMIRQKIVKMHLLYQLQLTYSILMIDKISSKMLTYDAITPQIVDEFIRSIQGQNHSEVRRYLTYCGKHIVNRLDSRTRMPSLYFAIKISDQRTGISCIKQLVRNGANLQFRDIQGNGYLHYACLASKLSIFKFMLQTLNVNEINIHQQSVLFTLCKTNNFDMLQHLCTLQQEVNVNQEDMLGRTALFYSAQLGYLQICDLLLKMGTDLDKIDKEGHNAQYYAKKANQPNILNLFYDYKKLANQIIQGQTSYNIFFLDNLQPRRLSIAEVLELLEENEYLKEAMTTEYINDLSQKAVSDIEWRDKAFDIVDSCLLVQGSVYFSTRVNQELFGITDYYEKIVYPMDFSTISKKLTYNGYGGMQEFKSDVMLVFKNCYEYNGEDHYISDIARNIQHHFQSRCIVDF